jgi:hypothetical protein
MVKAPEKSGNDQYSNAETRQRFDAALRGARISGHKPMSEIAPKKRKPTKKKDAGAGKPQRHAT